MGEQVLEILDRLIAQAEDKRYAQMQLIASLPADGEDVSEAKDGLRKIEELLEEMREQRLIQQQALQHP